MPVPPENCWLNTLNNQGSTGLPGAAYFAGMLVPPSVADFPIPRHLRDSAVLVPVFRDAAGDVQVVLVRRAAFGVHGGQLAFPGGKPEPTDENLLATALREAYEEVGLLPANVEVLASLPPVAVPTGFRITPYLGRIRRPAAWQWQAAEIDEVLEVPLRHLADAATHAEEVWQLPGWPGPRRVPFYRVGAGYALWGASYRIIQPLIPRLLAGEWDI
ncbi:NUDIX hydrolase [Hymenobacter weizhouensis]|uniref:NUDIX hydrolase n=1 Tax=Hymenobacter sp. YIM 151500-1 TaxID=2987689 RepID=UPI002227D752|nr:CoA pyrophosphatase [Hymenobacter sp. YIM 151500-1]UYZ63228.1 CoA pyrophosphatase [Hymenobacter sp. YIM 151500-1]